MTAAVAYYPLESNNLHDSTLSEPQRVEPQFNTFPDEWNQSNQIWQVQQGGNMSIGQKVRIVTNSRAPAWLPETIDSLNSLLALSDNWDSYGACTISHETTLSTVQVLLFVMEEQTPLPSIVPMPSGNIQLEWHRFGIDLEVEITSSKSYSISFEDERHEIAPHDDGAFRHSVDDSQPLLDFTNLVTQRATIEE